jgi:5'-nucleotidase
MHLLLTNDDGYQAEGLAALRAAAEPLGRVTVVAPRCGQSGQGHTVTIAGPITLEAIDHPPLGQTYVCDGTPADCVRLAVTELADGPVDWVLAGINHGANLGMDVYYSGTLAAVREAALLGCRAVALSQFVDPLAAAIDWDQAVKLAGEVLRGLLEQAGPAPPIWNVNLPRPTAAAPRARVVPLSADPLPVRFERLDSSDQESMAYRYCGVYTSRQATPGTDVATVFNNDIALTPIALEGTQQAALGLRLDVAAG